MATRQKSCTACVRAKRRCDLRVPRCARCRGKRINCQYKITKGSVELQTETHALTSDGNADLDCTFVDNGLANAYGSTCPLDFEFLLSPHSLSSPLDEFSLALEQTSMVEMVSDCFEYCSTQIKRYPELFAQCGGTPFIHVRLYQENMPSSIRHAFSTCAMYVGKTDFNTAITYRTLDAEISELLQTDSSLWSLEDALAHVQALLLYQIIRLFDGDIRQRVFAEQHNPILASWTDTLYVRLKQQCSPYSHHSLAEKSEWKSWILMESARRTVLMSLFLRGYYHALKTGFCSTIAAMADLPVSTRAVLWELESPARWQLALKAAEPDLIPYKDLTARWEEGELDGEEIGEFERLFIIACKGINRFEQRYLATKMSTETA